MYEGSIMTISEDRRGGVYGAHFGKHMMRVVIDYHLDSLLRLLQITVSSFDECFVQKQSCLPLAMSPS